MIPLVRASTEQVDLQYLASRLDDGLLQDETEVETLERAFAASLGGVGGLAVSSGTSALHLALLAVGVGPGDEVILPSYSCVALLHAVSLAGAIPVLVDNDLDLQACAFNASLDEIAAKVGKRTRAIIVTQMFGNYFSLEALNRLNIPVIEDVTHCLGISDESYGQSWTIRVTSLNWSKTVSAGQGGVLVFKGKEEETRTRHLCRYEELIGEWRYLPAEALRGKYQAAYNVPMSTLQAALGVSQLRQLPRKISRHREIAELYSKAMNAAGIAGPDLFLSDVNVFFRFIVDTNGKSVSECLEILLKRGIQCGRGVYPNLHLLLGRPDEQFPNASRLEKSVLAVPVHSGLTDAEVAHVSKEVCEVLKK